MKAFMKWGCICTYACGFAFCLFSCLSLRRFSVLCLVVAASLAVMQNRDRRKQIADAGNWFVAHTKATLAILFVVAIIMRVCFALSLPEDGIWHIQGNDPRKFWEYAHEMASGTFPDVKSWTHTFLLSLSIRAFGDTLVPVILTNTFLQFATAITLYAFARKVFSCGAAICTAAIYLLSPSLVHINFCARPETLFFLFFALTLLVLSKWVLEKQDKMLILLPPLIWLTIWTRGEAVLFLLLIPGCIAATMMISSGQARREALRALLFLIILCLGFAVAGYSVNLRYHGTNTPLCSNDSWWPRLFGSNTASRGRVPGPKTSPKGIRLSSDKTLIFERYRKDHKNDADGGVLPRKSMHCPNELIPYIKQEISRRWGALSTMEKLRFMIDKNWFPWNTPYAGKGQVPEKQILRTIRYDIATIIAILICLFGLARSVHLLKNRPLEHVDIVRAIPLLYLFGMVCVIAIAESNIRYGVIALLVCPLYAWPDDNHA